MFTVYCGALTYIGNNGGGTHIDDFDHLQLLTKWVVVSEAAYVVAMMMLKISLGIFFARIVVKPWQLGIIYVNVAVNIFSSAAAFFYVLLRCGPNIDKYVEQQLSDKCMPMGLDRFVAYQQAAFTTLTDIVFITIPILLLWNANMSRESKVSVGFVLSLATLYVSPYYSRYLARWLTARQWSNLLHSPLPLRGRPRPHRRLLLERRQHIHLVHHRMRRKHHRRLSRHTTTTPQATRQ